MSSKCHFRQHAFSQLLHWSSTLSRRQLTFFFPDTIFSWKAATEDVIFIIQIYPFFNCCQPGVCLGNQCMSCRLAFFYLHTSIAMASSYAIIAPSVGPGLFSTSPLNNNNSLKKQWQAHSTFHSNRKNRGHGSSNQHILYCFGTSKKGSRFLPVQKTWAGF